MDISYNDLYVATMILGILFVGFGAGYLGLRDDRKKSSEDN